jgi:hypothetical protein
MSKAATESLIGLLRERKRQIDEISAGNSDALGRSAGLSEAIAIAEQHDAQQKGSDIPLSREFSYEDKDFPYAFIQWKGTDACFDFYCKCRAHCHFDGYFAYYVQCPHCKTIYQMPFNLFPREVAQTDGSEPKLLEPDEDCQAEPSQEEMAGFDDAAVQQPDAVERVAKALLRVRGNSGQYGGSNPPTIEEEAKAAIAAMGASGVAASLGTRESAEIKQAIVVF